MIGIFAPGANGTSALTFGEQQTMTLVSSIRKGNLNNVDIPGSSVFNRFATQNEFSTFRPREFLAVFTKQNFIYFIVRIGIVGRAGMQMDQMRVVRFCKDDPGTQFTPQFVSHFELVGECSGSSSSITNIPTAATYVGANSAFGTATLLVTFMGDGETIQHMCAYNISTINNLMTQKFSDCLDGRGVSGFARDGVPIQCPTVVSEAQKRSAVSG